MLTKVAREKTGTRNESKASEITDSRGESTKKPYKSQNKKIGSEFDWMHRSGEFLKVESVHQYEGVRYLL
jgi:hypothetical protein